MQALSVATTENWSACLGLYRRRGDALLTSAAARRRTSAHYDTNGNLLNKKRYAYVPNGGTLGACLETISYGYDAETGWYYLQSRYYDPAVCRFISADALLSTGQGVLGHNTFAYCGNNPISRIDLNGYDWEDFWEWLKSIFSGGNSSCSGETQTADEVETVEVVLTSVPSTPEPISSSAKYPPVVDAYINEARQMIGDSYDERDCAQLVRASVFEYDEGFQRGARYQWAEYNSFLWKREIESVLLKYLLVHCCIIRMKTAALFILPYTWEVG